MLIVPDSVNISPRAYLTPSLFVQGRKCLARLAWASSDAARLVPDDPSAILGTALHRVQEQADRGELSDKAQMLEGAQKTVEDAARAAFDRSAGEALARAHPLIQMRYPRTSDLPRFYLQRARSVEMAMEHIQASAPPGGPRATWERATPPPLVEHSLASSDGTLRGRADRLDIAGQRIMDYKSGSGPADSNSVGQDEKIQLLFYAALARDNGITVAEGCIVRSDGRRVSCPLPADEARAVVDEARILLARFNTAVTAGQSPDAMASPSPTSCDRCSFRALCQPFWSESKPAWEVEVGGHAQMLVQEAGNTGTPRAPTVLVRGPVTGGSVPLMTATVSLPLRWIEPSVEPAQLIGRGLRLLHVRAEETKEELRLRLDRERGYAWLLPESSAID